jgi:hypothetical protein
MLARGAYPVRAGGFGLLSRNRGATRAEYPEAMRRHAARNPSHGTLAREYVGGKKGKARAAVDRREQGEAAAYEEGEGAFSGDNNGRHRREIRNESECADAG